MSSEVYTVCCPICERDMRWYVTRRDNNNVACKCENCGTEWIMKNIYLLQEWEYGKDRLAEEADE